MLKFHNTLTKQTEEFKSITPGKVLMYNCGPTVYDYAHIGNLRSYVFADILRRTLEWNDFAVNQVMNVTDIGHLSSDGDEGEDKMTKALKREGKPMTLAAMREVADFYFERFKEDLTSLNIRPATHFPFASDHITEDIALIERLSEKGFTYTTSDGVYFDISKFPEYGKLGGGISGDNSRIGENPEKRNQKDFAVWKFNEELGYSAPFGKGFPGWHIECSAMSIKYLGETFDIHTGGIDHIPVHHNNEIAQSESATGKEYARFWLHNAHVQIDGSKMAKSEGNFITLNTLRENKIHPLSYRFFLLQARYSTQINFTLESLLAAQNGFENLLKNILSLSDKAERKQGQVLANWKNIFTEKINDDLNTPAALAVISDLLSDTTLASEDVLETISVFDEALGLKLIETASKLREIPNKITELLQKRNEAKKEKDFVASDTIRDQIISAGYTLKDFPEKTVVERSLASLV
jgi:cysteinyl-tRNA synthetase